MDKNIIQLLDKYGWLVECEHPFEIRHANRDFATGLAAEAVLTALMVEENGGNVVFQKLTPQVQTQLGLVLSKLGNEMPHEKIPTFLAENAKGKLGCIRLTWDCMKVLQSFNPNRPVFLIDLGTIITPNVRLEEVLPEAESTLIFNASETDVESFCFGLLNPD